MREPDRGGAPGGGALHRSEERFRLLVESVADYAIFMLDPHGIVETWNVGAERLKGYREHEIVGRHYSVFYPAAYVAEELPARLLASARAEGRVEHAGWRVRKDGSAFWANVVITALYEEGGQLAGFAKVTRDMTGPHLAEQERERHLAEQAETVERLQQLDRWRTEFVAAIAHDLQTPVTAIAGFAGLLLDDTAEGDPTTREFLERIQSSAGSLQSLIDNLRDHTRLSERQIHLSPEVVDLRPFVHGLLDTMTPLLTGRTVTRDVADVTARIDRRALERVLRNLLGNAARHTPAGTAVHVRARSGDDHLVIEVEDEGPGIPVDLVPHAFDRFARGEHRAGTGLGLSIVRQYVELHGGSVSAESGRAGGALMRITLPHGLQPTA